MSLLSDEEIDACWNGPMSCGYGKSRYNIAKALQAAILAKLASAELPKPVCVASADWKRLDFYFGGVPAAGGDLFSATQLHEAYRQGAAAQLAEKPSAWKWTANKFHDRLEAYCPPDDAYDKGTLIELYTRREAK